MRKDMAKVIVERPRVGGKACRPPKWEKNAELDDLPTKEGIKRRWYRNRKELNENLRPLERLLEKRVGKSWNNVFEEICEHLRIDSAIQKHVRDHLKDLVYFDVVLKDNHPHYIRFGVRPIRKGDLFVHPVTSLLQKVRKDYARR